MKTKRNQVDVAPTKSRSVLVGLIVPVFLLSLWEGAAQFGFLNPFFFPAPSRIFVAALESFVTGSLGTDFGMTLSRIFAGFFLGGTTGYLIGLITGTNRQVRALLEPMLSALYTVPKIAILPIFLSIFGLGEPPKIALVSVTVFFYVWVYTLQAVLNIEPNFLDIAQTYTTNQRAILWHVIIPASLPQVFAGLRVAIAVATLITISSEFVVGDTGLGYVIFNSRLLMRVEESYVGIFVVAIMGFVFQKAVVAIGRRMTPWASNSRGAVQATDGN
jgi:sulfonate transport system permease protein